MMGWCFSLKSFAKKYAEQYQGIPDQIDKLASFDINEFAKRLWGDVYFNPETRSFKGAPYSDESTRTFVQFILEPIYKIYAEVVGEDIDSLRETLESLSIYLKPSVLKMDVKPLLRTVLQAFFGSAVGLADMLVHHVPSPVENAELKVCDSQKLIFKDGKYLYW
jgi:U5 small nuclear ribonucleoprotein component